MSVATSESISEVGVLRFAIVRCGACAVFLPLVGGDGYVSWWKEGSLCNEISGVS
jgi:hypothetical protein